MMNLNARDFPQLSCRLGVNFDSGDLEVRNEQSQRPEIEAEIGAEFDR
jgi:hypothetical protein